MFILTLLSIFNNIFTKPEFFDLSIGVLFFSLYEIHILDHRNVMVIFVLTCISIVLELFWLIFASKKWWDGLYGNTKIDKDIEIKFRQISVIFSYLAIPIKGILAYCLHELCLKLKSTSTLGTASNSMLKQ